MLTDQDRKYVYVVGPKDEALRKMCALMKEHPESFIRDVQDASGSFHQFSQA